MTWMPSSNSANGTIEIPRFTFESGYQLKKPLSDMGMTSIFASADLSQMIDNGNLLVDDVYHKTFIAVDEQGTEAAAATAIVVGETSAPMEEFQFRAAPSSSQSATRSPALCFSSGESLHSDRPAPENSSGNCNYLFHECDLSEPQSLDKRSSQYSTGRPLV